MTCSNEAIQYVSYPVAVLAKSCKLIPTMLVGQTVEGKLYSVKEWLAALAISAGILLFHWSRMEQQQQHKHANADNDNDDDDGRATYGMLLLLISCMDGVLSSCQNFLKRPPATTTMSATIEEDPATGGTMLTLIPGRTAYRPPNAVETMLYVNLYSLLFLIPACMYTGQWQHGVDALLHSGLSNNVGNGNSNDDGTSSHSPWSKRFSY
jgi:drug/metabolite transporter (DMT)-like permease